ncbi:hypothetical protein [Microseira wollei]|nr:hypothetical protein [Microseira wollei]
MIQTIPKSVTFDEFIAWYRDNSPHRYEKRLAQNITSILFTPFRIKNQ